MATRRFPFLLVGALAGFAAAGATAEESAPPASVDLKLVIAVDISPSMSVNEQRVQRQGYVAAFRSARLAEAVASGAYGRIAVAYLEWAGVARIAIPWTVVDGAATAEAFAARLEARPIRQRLRTSISTALAVSSDLIRKAPFAAERSVIDISGDGPNNAGPPVLVARDAALAEGIVINGLPIMLDQADAGQGFFETRGLDRYYRDCVIGGPGAFAIPVTRLDALVATIERKLLTEIAAARVDVLPVAEHTTVARADCMVGERAARPLAR